MHRVRRWVRAALSAEDGAAVPAPDLTFADGPTAAELLDAIAAQRVVELLHERADVLALPGPLVADLARVRAASRRQVHVQVVDLHRASAALDAAGVPHLFFKGLALAVQTTGDAAARGPGDLDVLVPAAAAPTALDALARAGWTAGPRAPRPGTWAWRWLDRIYGAQTLTGPGAVLDLHWRLDATLDALPGFDDLWARRALVDLAGREVATLGARDALAHSCLHAAKDEWRWLRSLVDVHRLAGRADLRTRPPARLELTTLAVTRARGGLPAGLPDDLVAALAGVGPDAVLRAGHAQDGDATTTPHAASRWLARYQLEASSSSRDVRRLVAALLVPAGDLDGITARSGRSGLPRAVGRRVYRLVSRRPVHAP
jgi:hypothetical protein